MKTSQSGLTANWQTVRKEHEKKLENTVPGLTVKLHSYILSPTQFSDLGEACSTKEDYNSSGVYFMDDPDYLEQMCADIFG
ncbi:MAG: prominin family protein [Treponema sp.]|nr:prominin family protein [Treponema sp.]